MDRKFWVEEPCLLVTQPYIFPTPDMSKTQKLNALTRLVLIAAGVMYLLKCEWWFVFLLVGVLAIVLLNYNSLNKKHKDDDKEHFSIVPTYMGSDFNQTIIAPTFAEEWQIPPPAYDIYTQVPYPGAAQDTFETPLQPQSYPYGQYLTRTNLLPSDEYYTHLGCGGAKTAREYINSTYLRHDLAHRENISRLFKKKLNRRFRSNCNDTFSPFHSY